MVFASMLACSPCHHELSKVCSASMGEVCPGKDEDERMSCNSVPVRQNYHREVLAAQLELSVQNQEVSQAFLTCLQLVLSA